MIPYPLSRLLGLWLSVLSVGFLCACHRDPPWTIAPAKHPGEATVLGEPIHVPRLSARPILDGKLDDPAWASAAVLGPLGDAGSGAEVDKHPVAAWARMGWDDEKIYLGVVVRDRAPRSPFHREDFDPHVWGASSGIEMILQPGDPGDNRDYYELQVDVAGAVFDSHFDDYNLPVSGAGRERLFGHQDWSSRVERGIFVDEGHFYSIELAVPWSAFAPGRVPIPPRAGDVWRLNLYSFRDGQRLSLAWSPLRGQGNFHRAARFGRIRFE